MNRLGEAAACDKEYLNEEALRQYENCLIEIRRTDRVREQVDDDSGDEVVLNNKITKALHKAVRYRVYNMAVSSIGMRENMTNAYLESIDKISNSRNGKAYTELNGGYRVRRETNKLVFYRV